MRVDLAGGDHVVLLAAAQAVAVDVELVLEAVEVAALLELGERPGQAPRVEQADVRHRGLVGGHRLLDRALGLVGGPRIGLDVHVGQAERLAGRGDVAADRQGLAVVGVRADRELLQDGGPGRADEDAREHQQGQRDHRDLEVAQDHRGEERAGADHRDNEQDQLRRHRGIEVGVARAVEVRATDGRFAVGEQQVVAVEEVPERLEQHERPGQHGEVGAGRGGDAAVAPGQPDATEDVVGDERRDEAHREADEHPTQQQPVEGQREDVEADVVAEHRVGLVEGHRVEEQLGGLPVALRGEPGDEGDDGGDADGEPAQPRQDHRSIPGHRVLGARAGHEDQADPVGDEEVEGQQAAHEDRGHDELHDAGEEHRRPHAAEPDLAEPGPVDVDVDQLGAADQHDEDHRAQHQQPLGTPGQLRRPARGPVGHGSHAPGRLADRAVGPVLSSLYETVGSVGHGGPCGPRTPRRAVSFRSS